MKLSAITTTLLTLAFSMQISANDNYGSDCTTSYCNHLEAMLDQVVVTATRTPKALKNVPVLTRVINSKEIAGSDADNVQDLLTRELPGLEFGYAMTGETSLRMNGLGGNAVLFLVDGERLAGETMDNIDYSRLDLQNAGNIEIIKGAASALYGANAVAGVVNIISQETEEPWNLKLNSRYGSENNSWRYGGRLGLNFGKFNSTTSAQYSKSATLNLTDFTDTESKIRQVYGGNSLSIRERLVFRANKKLQLTARGSYFARESHRDTYNDHYNDYSGGLKAKYQNFELSYAYDRYDKARYINNQRTDDHNYSNRQHTVHALYNHDFDKNINLTCGADYTYDYLSSYQFTDNGNHSQHSADVFAQIDVTPLQWLNIIGSVRYDYFSASQSNSVTARLAAMAKLGNFRLRANYAGGFRAPTLKEMYMNFDMAGLQMIYGNPDLKPEKSHNASISLEHSGRTDNGAYSITATGSFTNYDNRITTIDFDIDTRLEEGAKYYNEASMNTLGVDIAARYRNNCGLGVTLNYNFLQCTGQKIDSQFSQPRPHSATWRIDYERNIKKHLINAAISGRYMGTPDTKQMKHDSAYQLWKLSVGAHLKYGIGLNFAVDNIFGYRPKVYYWNSVPTTGRSWSISLLINLS